MKSFTLVFFMLAFAASGLCTTWTIISNGNSFSPATLTIQEGDTVIFDLTNDHNSAEVSQATWNSNGTTPLAGGWALPLGGGMVLPADLTPGTHFYVCQPHAAFGMKGQIIVEETTAVEPNPHYASISIYPNPSNGKIQFLHGSADQLEDLKVEIYDVQGVRVYAASNSEITDISQLEIPVLEKGIYFVRLGSDKGISTKRVVVQ